MGTTTEVVIVLDRIAPVVIIPQKKDFPGFLKKKRLNRSGELAKSIPEISLLKRRIEENNKINDVRTSTNPFEIVLTKKSIIELNPDHPVENVG
jgi:hypothetical protein